MSIVWNGFLLVASPKCRRVYLSKAEGLPVLFPGKVVPVEATPSAPTCTVVRFMPIMVEMSYWLNPNYFKWNIALSFIFFISCFNSKEFPKLLMNLVPYLDKFDNVTTPGNIFNRALSLPIDIATEKDKSWFQLAMLSTVNLLENCILPPLCRISTFVSKKIIHLLT